MSKEKLALMVLDQSGSMASVWDDTIGGYNAYVEGLKGSEAKLGLMVFSTLTGAHVVHPPIPVDHVQPLTKKSYVPDGGTPLYDAIGYGILLLDGYAKDRQAEVVIIVLTDGHENSSKEYTLAGIKALLEERQKAGWLVVYLGANQDAWEVGEKMGTQFGNTASYGAQNTAQTMRMSSQKAAAYFQAGGGAAGQAAAFFTDEERAEALKDKPTKPEEKKP